MWQDLSFVGQMAVEVYFSDCQGFHYYIEQFGPVHFIDPKG